MLFAILTSILTSVPGAPDIVLTDHGFRHSEDCHKEVRYGDWHNGHYWSVRPGFVCQDTLYTSKWEPTEEPRWEDVAELLQEHSFRPLALPTQTYGYVSQEGSDSVYEVLYETAYDSFFEDFFDPYICCSTSTTGSNSSEISDMISDTVVPLPAPVILLLGGLLSLILYRKTQA